MGGGVGGWVGVMGVGDQREQHWQAVQGSLVMAVHSYNFRDVRELVNERCTAHW